ncbi:hypothetical protein C356_06876 [Cryptococcus neoformans c45]|nr:hypothetical protein C356_06876 [Cryptococcus neoformans var. grubii c45]
MSSQSPSPFPETSAGTSSQPVDSANNSQWSFAPPPLPPRPPPGVHRKPVPAMRDSDLHGQPLQRHSMSPPPVPPRPVADIAAPPAIYTTVHNTAAQSSLPPPPPPPGLIDEKKNASQPPPGKKRGCYPSTRRGRLWFWGLIALIILAIVVIVAVCASVIPKNNSSSDTTTTSSPGKSYHGGHPLSIAEGGVDIGQPGDIAVFGKNSTDHFVMTTNRSIVVTRLDPVVFPGSIGAHVHRVHGSSYFTQNLTSATEMQKLANCTTTVVQDDLSAYWVAGLYYRYPNGSLASVRLDRTSLYYFQKAPTGVPIYPFPDNYNIIAGNPYRRAINTSDPTHTSKWFQCYRGGGNDLRSYGFPKSPCSGGLVQAIQFPSCWDGVYAEDGDYSTHVAYPTDDTNGYYCPPDFPKKFITVQFETVFAVYDFPYNGNDKITWVLSNGDTSGYGIHADFMNGWKPETLEAVLNDCRYLNATSEDPIADDPPNCPALNKSINMDITYSCRLQTPIVNEGVGEHALLQYLPGCNALWSGNTSKPPCPSGHIDGGDLDLVSPSVWYREEPYISS